MFQLINGCIECAECRNDIRHGDEFDCYYCGASICGVVYLFMRMTADPANMGTETSGLPDNSRTLQSDTKARAPRRAEALVVGKFFET